MTEKETEMMDALTKTEREKLNQMLEEIEKINFALEHLGKIKAMEIDSIYGLKFERSVRVKAIRVALVGIQQERD